MSLDGYPENHNRNRVDVKGRDTADIVLKHIDQFRELIQMQAYPLQPALIIKLTLKKWLISLIVISYL